jgi:hypothetical protein
VLIRCIFAASALLLAAACGPARSAESGSEDRFELKHDERGRVVRLDKTTGEMAIVTGDRLIPVKSPDAATRTPRNAAGAPESPKNPRGEGPSTKSPTEPAAPIARVPQESVVGRQLPLQTAAPVFITATATQTPLTVLPAGFSVRVMGIEADRYLVEFDDRQWGRRAGFVAASAISARAHNTSRPPAAATPVEPSPSTPPDP